MSYKELVLDLIQATDAQLTAAKALDTAALDQATQDRADLLFELEVELQEGVPEAERLPLRPLVEQLLLLEKRVGAVISLVNGSLDQILSYDEPTYAPRRAG
ncbi:MAG: hypothetical protein ACI9VR_002267 [Cognaticolwellia sp.]